MRGLNVSFPIDRLRELVARGELGGLGAQQTSRSWAGGATPAHERDTGPEVGRRLPTRARTRP